MNPHDYLNAFKNYEASLDRLSGKEFDLSRISELLDLLGSPQKKLKIIHVAGSKGKGSTCAFLSHILAAAGSRVGLYSSPHLHVLNERIRVLDKAVVGREEDFGGMITDDQLGDVVNVLRPHIAAMTNRGSFLTFFEVLTAAALVFFKRQDVDWVVLETGLGGRLDATNAVESMIAVLTPISLEHTHILGDTVVKIAAEKCGIIKNSRQRVVIAPQVPEVMAVILKRCQEFGIPPITVDPSKVSDFKLGLKGEHQHINAAAALQVVGLLRQWAHKIPDEAVAAGLKHTRWPGRFEVMGKDPLVILDGAHNEASAQWLAKALAATCKDRPLTLVIGLSADKEPAPFINVLRGIASRIILTSASHPRARQFTAKDAKLLLKGTPHELVDGVEEALDAAFREAGSGGAVVVTGSLFLVAEARALLRE